MPRLYPKSYTQSRRKCLASTRAISKIVVFRRIALRLSVSNARDMAYHDDDKEKDEGILTEGAIGEVLDKDEDEDEEIPDIPIPEEEERAW